MTVPNPVLAERWLRLSDDLQGGHDPATVASDLISPASTIRRSASGE
jgi:hypothetical protein